MREIRCARCSKLLAKAAFSHLQIKCPRCKAFNDMQAESLSQSTAECPTGKTQSGENKSLGLWLCGFKSRPGYQGIKIPNNQSNK